MSPTTRTLAWVAVLGVLLGAALGCLLISRTSHGSGVHGVASPSVVDSSAAVRVRDSLAAGWADSRRRFRNLQTWIDAAPADTVWRVVRRLVRDTVDTGRIDTFKLVRALVLDDSACRMGNDSLRGAMRLAGLRLAAERERVALLAQGCRPSPLGGSERPWTLAGGMEIDGDRTRPGVVAEARSGWASYGVSVHATRALEHPSIGVHFGFNFGGF